MLRSLGINSTQEKFIPVLTYLFYLELTIVFIHPTVRQDQLSLNIPFSTRHL